MPIPEQFKAEWESDCLKWRGKVLTGKHAHWCHEWDGLPVDETTPEYEACLCGAVPDGPNQQSTPQSFVEAKQERDDGWPELDYNCRHCGGRLKEGCKTQR